MPLRCDDHGLATAAEFVDQLGGRQRPRSGARRKPALAVPNTRSYGEPVAELPTPEIVENRRRSIAMLPSGAPALDRDEALELLGQLEAALLALRKLKAQGEVR